MTKQPAWSTPPPVNEDTALKMFNFKATVALHKAIEHAATADGVNRSEWSRRVLEDATGLSGSVVLRCVVAPNMRAMIDAAALSAGLSATAFMQQALEAASRRELERAARQAVNNPEPNDANCSHPLPARRQVVNRVLCEACGKVLRWL